MRADAAIGRNDVLLAVSVAVVAVLGATMLPTDWLDGRRADWFGLLLLVLSCVPVLVRRRWPVAALLAVVPPQIVYHALEYAHEVALLIAVPLIYTVAVTASRAVMLSALGVTSLALVATVGLSQDAPPGTDVIWPLGWFVAAAVTGQAVRIHRAFLAETAERRVAEERLRIARDLHDVLAHHIVVINSHAAVAAHLLDERPDLAPIAESLHTIADASSGVLSELRTTLDVLRGNEVDDRQPTPGLDRLADLASAIGAAGVTVEVAGERRPLPPAVEVTLYRIAQEALTNVVKHAAARHARVVLTHGSDEVRMEVADDGHGAPLVTGRSGYGIVGMTERAQALGGQLSAGNGPDGGFRVVATLPIVGDAR
jgi:signal transduction histidine kinase